MYVPLVHPGWHVCSGICLGVLSAICCHVQSGPWIKALSEGKQGIALQTLSYGIPPDLDIADSYERAMKARHVGNSQNLTIVDPSEIVLFHIIGEGSFGRVWSALWQTSQVAVKEFVFAQAAVSGGSSQRRDIIEEIVGEAGIMSYLMHPRILQLYGCSLTAQAIWIVSELCSEGSLRQVLDDKARPLPLAHRLQMAIDVAEGMSFLHSREPPIIHRDLKSHNLFVTAGADGRPTVKIGDWGSARAVALSGQRDPKTMTHGVGTVAWLAPEVIKHAKGSERIDVYSFGIVLWELATREEVISAACPYVCLPACLPACSALHPLHQYRDGLENHLHCSLALGLLIIVSSSDHCPSRQRRPPTPGPE